MYLETSIATIYACVGVVSLLAGLRMRAVRTAALLLAWAMLQHAADQVGIVARGAGADAPVLFWLSQISAYFIAVPWAMLLEQLIGRGWRSSIRITWIVYLASAIASVLVDLVSGQRGTASAVNAYINAAGAFVGLANLYAMRPGPRPVGIGELKVLRAGILVFLALVVHDGLARAGLLPWRTATGPLGLFVSLSAILYTVVSVTLRGQRELHDIEQELATARRIQSMLLPSAAPRLDGAKVAFRYVPAAAVAGDLFEFLAPSPRAIGILVADVSGHGVPAALIASMVKVAAAAQRGHAHDPAAVLSGIHLALAGELPQGHFVTAVYVYVDLDAGLLRHAAAGHPPAIVWQACGRAFAPPGATGPLILPIAPPDYPVAEIPLAAGDRVLLYTDGVVEAMRADGEMFGVERLRALVEAPATDPDTLVAAITDAAEGFAGRRSAGFEDDITLVALEVDGPPSE